MGLGVT